MTGWGPGQGDFRDVPDMLRRLAAEMGFGGPPPVPPRPPRPPHGEHGRGGGRRGEFGGPPWAGPWGPPWARGPRHHRAPRAGRGDVRSALLALLAEEPMHGYQMISEIGRRSGGSWRPSPGSVYPTLQQLEDEGLVRAEERDGRRVYRLTEDGRRHVAGRADEFADLWEGMAPRRDEGGADLGDLVFGVAAAFFHVMRTGSSDQVEQARRVLARTRADLYRILGGDAGLADDDADDEADDNDRDEDQDEDQDEAGRDPGADGGVGDAAADGHDGGEDER